MKMIGIFFTAPDYDDYPFDEPEYRQAYHLIGSLLLQRGVQLAIVRSPQTYQGGMRFRGGWVYQGDTFERTEKELTLNVIYNKGRFHPDATAVVINHPELEATCTDKWKTYQVFPGLCPLTFRVESANEVAAALRQIPTQMAVAKPIDLEGGTGVLVLPKEDIATRIPSYPYLLQAFIDASNGIPDITDGLHDLRLIVAEGEIVSTLLRMPKPGSFLANVSQGGTKRIIPLEDIPAGARDLCRKIDEEFARFSHRLYSVDVARDADATWRLIELNSQPGLSIDDYHESDVGKRLFENLIHLLVTAAEEQS